MQNTNKINDKNSGDYTLPIDIIYAINKWLLECYPLNFKEYNLYTVNIENSILGIFLISKDKINSKLYDKIKDIPKDLFIISNNSKSDIILSKFQLEYIRDYHNVNNLYIKFSKDSGFNKV